MEISTTPLSTFSPPGSDLTSLGTRASAGDKKALETIGTSFESLFFSLLVKQMRQTLEPAAMFGQDQSDILGGLFDHYLGQHLAQSGSLGIAALIKKQLEQTGSSR